MIKNEDSTNRCHQCGACCHMQISMTILDIHRIADYLEKPDRVIFQKIIGEISNKRKLFKIAKIGKQNKCIFLDDNNMCEIHPAKPNVCRFYQCTNQDGKEEMDWTAYYRDISERAKLWEQSVAAKITEQHIEKNHSNWNEEDFFKSLESIKENIITKDSQKLNHTPDNGIVSMVSDCSQCKKRKECAKAAHITLDDIQRIADHLDIPAQIFFEDYVSTDKCLYTGGLKLRTDKHCILFNNPKQECYLDNVKPLHCRFITCPIKTKNTEIQEILHLGSGTIKGQFRHQVALQMTREYVSQYGTKYKPEVISYFLNQLKSIINNPAEMKDFMSKIEQYRYVNDTRAVSNPKSNKIDLG